MYHGIMKNKFRNCTEAITILTLQSPVVTAFTTRFNIRHFTNLTTKCMYLFCMGLRTNSDYFHIQHTVTVLHNCDGVCLVRATDSSLNVSQIKFTLQRVKTNCSNYTVKNTSYRQTSPSFNSVHGCSGVPRGGGVKPPPPKF